MKFPNDFLEAIFMIALFVTGSVIYALATRNRGSFVDTPDWSKVIRRIIELVCVLISILFIGFIGQSFITTSEKLFITLPIIGFTVSLLIMIVTHFISKKKQKPFKENLTEHLVNAIILTIFLLSSMLIGFVTFARIFEYGSICAFLLLIVDFLLSIEFAFLLYQLYYMIVINNIPGEEIIQIIKITKDLNE